MLSSRRIRLVGLCALALVLAAYLAACTAQKEPAEKPAEQPAAQSSEPTPEPAAEATGAEAQPVEGGEQLHTSDVKVTGREIVVITTSRGVIKFEVFAKEAPNTVASFIELAEKKFYDGTKFHRVEPGFVIQGGDPLSKTDDMNVGTGGPGWRLKAEFSSRKHVLGTVGLARAQDPDSGGSQFYITLGPQPSLDGQYTVFGQVTSGIDVVKSIKAGDVVKSIRVERGK